MKFSGRSPVTAALITSRSFTTAAVDRVHHSGFLSTQSR